MISNIESEIKKTNCKSGHLFDYWSEMKRRDELGIVSCKCARCGKTFSDTCGVNLTKYGWLAPLWQYGIMYA